MSSFSFDIEDARLYGVDAAIFLSSITHWLDKNAIEGRNIRENSVWTYNTDEEYINIFPWMDASKLKRVRKKLRDNDVIITAQFEGFNRRNWITLSDYGRLSHNARKCLEDKRTMHGPKTDDGTSENEPSNVRKQTFNNTGSKQVVPNSKQSKPVFSASADEKPKTKNLPSRHNPAFARHKEIAQAAFDQNGQTYTFHKIESLMGVIDDCTAEWSMDDIADAIPSCIRAMHDRGNPIAHLDKFFAFKGSGGNLPSKHPIGQYIADKRTGNRTDDEIIAASSAANRQAADDMHHNTVEPANVTVDYSAVRDIMAKRKRGRFAHLKEIEQVTETDDDVAVADKNRAMIRAQLEQLTSQGDE